MPSGIYQNSRKTDEITSTSGEITIFSFFLFANPFYKSNVLQSFFFLALEQISEKLINPRLSDFISISQVEKKKH